MISEKMYELGSKRSYIRELFEYGKKKAAQVGANNVFDFSLGNPNIPSPQAVEDSIRRLLDEETPFSLHSYTSAPGNDDLRTALAKNLSKRYNAQIGAENLFIIGGAASGLVACLKAVTTDAESEIIVIAPFFPEYRVFAEAGAGAVLKIVEADMDGFQINFDALEAAVSPNTCGVIINSPNNPSGAVYTEQTLSRLGELLKRKSIQFGAPIYLISDEPYRELAYGDTIVPYVPKYYPNTLVCYSFSKSLSLPGERIGYVEIPAVMEGWEEVYFAVAGAARAIGHVCAPSLMQKVIALSCDIVPEKGIYEKNSFLLYENMLKMGYRCAKPQGAFYLFFEAPGGLSAREFSELAKERHNILIVPGDDFGCPTYLRLSYCVPTERIERVLPLLENLADATKV